MVKNCDLGLENAARGLRPRAVFSRQFFTIRTSQLANNIYIFELRIKTWIWKRSYIIQAWIFFRPSFPYCLSSVHNCEDRFHIHIESIADKSLNEGNTLYADLCLFTSAVQSPDIKPCRCWEEIFRSCLLGAVIYFTYLIFSIVVIALTRDLLSTFHIAEMWSRHRPPFKDGSLESHTLYVYLCPALIISSSILNIRDGKENW